MAYQRVSAVNKCLFCNRRQPPAGEKSECYVEVSGKQLRKAFWICEQCGASEKDRTRALHGIVLAETKSKAGDGRTKETAVVQVVTVDSTIGVDVSKQHSVVENESGAGSCCCQACVERKHFEQEQLREVQSLQKFWLQLRHAVRQMYRDRLLRDGMTGKGKKFDLNRLCELIGKFCARDPHQLYQRLESLGREHVMELKVLLLQILVSPEKTGVAVGSNSESIASNMSSEVAEHFLRSLLNFASQFFETVDNMKEFLSPLEKDHLEKFGVTWRIVNCNLFDSVVYHDPLLQATLPSIYTRLGFKMTPDESAGEGNVSVIVDRKSTPSHVADMMKNFVELGTTLTVCRNRMETAQERMEKYLSKQMKIYKATLKAKQKILKQDLEFFKHQRRLLEDYVTKKKELKKTNSGDEDVSAFAETLRCLISGNNNNRSNCEHSASTAECIRCHRSHCPCDQCSISHLIACGLTSENEDIELPESIPFLDDLNGSSNSSSSDSEDSDYGIEEECVSDKRQKMDIICHKQTSIICGDGQKITKVEATILPTSLYSVHSADYTSTAVVQRHMYNAYGDWEVNVDPSTLLFSNRWEEILLSKCAKQMEHASGEEEKIAFESNGGEHDGQTKISSNDDKTADEQQRKSAKSENGVSKMDNGSSSEKSVPLDQTYDKIPTFVRHKLTACAKLSNTKRSDGVCPDHAAATKPKCESKERKPDIKTSPRKQPPSNATTPVRNSQSTNCQQHQQQQFTQEWFKDPKNAKYAKALLACAVAGNSKDAACLKELNLDVETVKKLYAQHVEAAAANKGSDQTPNCGETIKTKTITLTTKTHHGGGDSVSADEDDDSWSDDHSSVVSQKENKHCDCCYCEMFGHSGVDFQKGCGRDEYPQIRERLRSKLKKKASEMPSHQSQNVDGYRGYESLDTLLEYINGGKGGPRNNDMITTSGAVVKTATNKAKKSRTKSKRTENKKAEKRDHDLTSSRRSSFIENDNENDVTNLETFEEKLTDQSEYTLAETGDDSMPTEMEKNFVVDSIDEPVVQSQASAQQYNSVPKKKKSRKRNGDEEDVNIDEVFKPKDIDLNSTELDEAEREIECFKRFVMNCQPRENREKVHLNIGHLMRDKKAAVM